MTEFFANFKQAPQQAQKDGDESAHTVDSNVVWRQTLSKPYKNQVMGPADSSPELFAPPIMEVPLPLPPALRQAPLRKLLRL
ncbi:hypothetical protein PIB30_070139 [Stylosanthes scabra]|uniref:Uncharacterized protein n=1 Tax=Stylosanthes scabra TaxID=79078 RepID=A0ABU6VLU1_9FABA|nr:hypothetical protein [Stylosanthes scabra]